MIHQNINITQALVVDGNVFCLFFTNYYINVAWSINAGETEFLAYILPHTKSSVTSEEVNPHCLQITFYQSSYDISRNHIK